MAWSPQQYLKFEDERTRAARDLLNAVPAGITAAADLGCGPGNSTALIAARFPGAFILGVDNSDAMIEEAKKRLPNVAFELQDIAAWTASRPLGLIFANASLQWTGNHGTLLPRLVSNLSPGGCFAMQMPDNLDEPSHASMRAAASQMPFSDKLREASAARPALNDPAWYYELLKPHCSRVDIWKTTYLHPLAGIRAIVEWVKGTGLMPFLKPLTEAEQAIYLATYENALKKAYKPLADGTVILPFPRLFIVAIR